MSPSRRPGNARVEWRANIAGVMARSRGCAAGGATGRRALRGYEGRTETPPQNSQRVLLAKPRTAPMVRRREPGGPAAELCALPQRDTSVERGEERGAGCAGCQATHRADGAAARWGHRALPPSRTRSGYGNGTHEEGARQRSTRGGARRGGASEDMRVRGSAGAGMDREVVKK